MDITLLELIIYTIVTVFVGMNIGVALEKKMGIAPYLFNLAILLVALYFILK
ncbi:MAG: hypothetical protein ACRCX2_10100 [Paraclostridium sp.]